MAVPVSWQPGRTLAAQCHVAIALQMSCMNQAVTVAVTMAVPVYWQPGKTLAASHGKVAVALHIV